MNNLYFSYLLFNNSFLMTYLKKKKKERESERKMGQNWRSISTMISQSSLVLSLSGDLLLL